MRHNAAVKLAPAGRLAELLKSFGCADVIAPVDAEAFGKRAPTSWLWHQMRFDQSRRDFIALLGGAAVAWPHAARAQVSERIRRIGALLSSLPDDPLSQTVVGAFSQGLQECGWAIGRNVRIEYRWAAIDDNLMRGYATELVAFAPDVILAFGSVAAKAVERESREVPIVFVNASDPVGAGLVESLARPGGQATGFLSIEPGMSTKWLELLPRLARLAPQDCYEQKRAHEQPAAAFADSDRLRLGTQVVPLCRQQPQTVPSQSKLRA